MVEVTSILLGISLILFFGFFAEYLFKKVHIPDVLLLILLGFAIGPHGLSLVQPTQVAIFAPVFTTFALLFLMYDGAYNIDLKSLASGLKKSILLTLSNFILSSIIITGILFFFKFDILIALLAGFTLGGISSAFVIPVLKQLKIKSETYTILTIESAITDVLCIVSAVTVMEVILIQTLDVQAMLGSILSLFAIAGVIGLIAGALWVFIITRVFKNQNSSYMLTIAYVILTYLVTEFLGGNGAIACLFLGIVLKNSGKIIWLLGKVIKNRTTKERSEEFLDAVSVTSEKEKEFYAQVSFFLKTFFFVYIGLLFSISENRVLLIGVILAVAVLLSRIISNTMTKDLVHFDRQVVTAVFARGLAAAAIIQLATLNKLPGIETISPIVYAFIVFSILLSSLRIFFIIRKNKKNNPAQIKT